MSREAAAAKMIAHISKLGEQIESVTPAGSLRRGKETIGDLDLLLTLAQAKFRQTAIEAMSRTHPGLQRD